MGFVAGSIFLYFFYQSFWVVVIGIPVMIIFCRWKQKQLCKKRRNELENQFKDWLECVIVSLQSGNSVENAFIKAGKEMALFYGEDADIRREMKEMNYLLENNVTLEKILLDLGNRSGSEDIRNFAEVFLIGKRSGGNLREIIESCCSVIVMKMDLEREIQTMIHGKVLELKVMCVVPFGIILYISISSPGYFSPLYHNVAGICIMTGCLLFYLGAVVMSAKIVKIED